MENYQNISEQVKSQKKVVRFAAQLEVHDKLSILKPQDINTPKIHKKILKKFSKIDKENNVYTPNSFTKSGYLENKENSLPYDTQIRSNYKLLKSYCQNIAQEQQQKQNVIQQANCVVEQVKKLDFTDVVNDEQNNNCNNNSNTIEIDQLESISFDSVQKKNFEQKIIEEGSTPNDSISNSILKIRELTKCISSTLQDFNFQLRSVRQKLNQRQSEKDQMQEEILVQPEEHILQDSMSILNKNKSNMNMMLTPLKKQKLPATPTSTKYTNNSSTTNIQKQQVDTRQISDKKSTRALIGVSKKTITKQVPEQRIDNKRNNSNVISYSAKKYPVNKK